MADEEEEPSTYINADGEEMPMPEKGSLAWIHIHNQGSPIFGDPDAQINNRSVPAELLSSFPKVSVTVDGETVEVMYDDRWGPLKVMADGSGRYMSFPRGEDRGGCWRMLTSTHQNVKIHQVAKMNKRMEEKRLEKEIAELMA